MIFLFALIGLLLGSFTNVLISRTKTGESAFKGRSHCDHCHKQLSWYELIPLVSYGAQAGRCRKCHKPIPIQYPLVEVAVSLSFVALYLHLRGTQQQWLQLIIMLFITMMLVADFVYDWRWHELPDQFSLPAIGAGVALLLVTAISGQMSWGDVAWRLAGALAAGGFIAALWGVSGGRWMGDGDIRLAFLMGLLLNWQSLLLALFVAFNAGAIYALGLLITKKKHYQDRVAFGPFLIVGLYVAYFWGAQIVNWYLNLPLRLS